MTAPLYNGLSTAAAHVETVANHLSAIAPGVGAGFPEEISHSS